MSIKWKAAKERADAMKQARAESQQQAQDRAAAEQAHRNQRDSEPHAVLIGYHSPARKPRQPGEFNARTVHSVHPTRAAAEQAAAQIDAQTARNHAWPHGTTVWHHSEVGHALDFRDPHHED